MNRAELAGKGARVPRDRPGSARCGHVVAAVRPAEQHSEIHPSHVALTAAHILRAGILGAPVGALLVILDNGDPAEAPVEAGAVVAISGRAVAAAQKQAAAFRPSSQGTAVSALCASPLTRAQFVGVYPNVDMLPGDVVNATQPYPEEAE